MAVKSGLSSSPSEVMTKKKKEEKKKTKGRQYSNGVFGGTGWAFVQNKHVHLFELKEDIISGLMNGTGR